MFALMEITTQVPDKWNAAKPSDGFIEIHSEITGKAICMIEISDFNNLEHAQQIAQAIASLPELMNDRK
jgi:hypothetical protein